MVGRRRNTLGSFIVLSIVALRPIIHLCRLRTPKRYRVYAQRTQERAESREMFCRKQVSKGSFCWPHHLRDDIRGAGRPHKFKQRRSLERCGVLFHYYATYPWEENTWKGQMWGVLPFAHFYDVGVCNLLNDLCPRYPQLVRQEDDLHLASNA